MKKKQPDPHSFEAIEKFVKDKIAEIAKVPDAGDRLLQYREFRQSLDEIYEAGKAKKGQYGDSERKTKIDDWKFVGGVVGGLAASAEG